MTMVDEGPLEAHQLPVLAFGFKAKGFGNDQSFHLTLSKLECSQGKLTLSQLLACKTDVSLLFGPYPFRCLALSNIFGNIA